MRKTVLMVGSWDGAARLVQSAISSGWRVLHTPCADDASETVDELQPSVVVLCGSDAVDGWRRASNPSTRLPTERTGSGSQAGRRSVGAALDFIDLNHAEPITLADAARVATYSRCHFSKTFKEQVGVGFVAYLNSVRISHARQLLSTSDASVTEIALAVGFGDLCHFERIFRREQGETPSQFRARTRRL